MAKTQNKQIAEFSWIKRLKLKVFGLKRINDKCYDSELRTAPLNYQSFTTASGHCTRRIYPTSIKSRE